MPPRCEVGVLKGTRARWTPVQMPTFNAESNCGPPRTLPLAQPRSASVHSNFAITDLDYHPAASAHQRIALLGARHRIYGSNKRPNREECLTIDAHRMPCRGNSGHRMPCRGTPAWICACTGAGCRWPPGPWAARNETQTNQNGRQQSDLTLLNINRVEIWHAA